MSLIKTLMGRRQFLIATGIASGCALTCQKLAGFQTRVAMAEEKAMNASLKAAGSKCPNLLSPLKIRHTVLKNRILHTQSPPHSLQGPENFPTDAFRLHYSNMAKNAAIVSMDDHFGTYPISYEAGRGTDHYSDHIWQDIPPVHNYVNRLIDDIHSEGALVRYVGSTGGGGGMPSGGGTGGGGMPSGGQQGGASGGQGAMPSGGQQGGGASGGQGAMPSGGQQGGASGGQGAMPSGGQQGGASGGQGAMPSGGQQGGASGGQGAMPQGGGMQQGGASGGQGGMPQGGGQQSTTSTADLVKKAKEIEDQGYDVYTMSGTKEQVEAVRAATKLIIMAQLRVGGGGGRDSSILHKWEYEGSNFDWQFGKGTPGITNSNEPTKDELEQAVEAAKKLEGLADIVWIRDGRHEHPNDWTQNSDKPFNLYYAEAVKKAGVNLIVCPSAGFHDAVANDQFIASGITDMVGMTTPFFCDPDLILKASEGRTDDILPCIQCHNCHGISRTHGPWYDTCTVNPKWATPEYKLKNITTPSKAKKVAVIGGGPAGMKAAITAAERGHKVTLFEKDKTLGGLLQFSDYTQWKWNYKRLKDYLVHQVGKHGVEVRLNTTATPDMIKKGGYDSVVVAAGATPTISKMPGADGKNVFNIIDCYSNKKALGKKVVVIGAGRIGTETAMGIAKDGHKVTILCSSNDLIELEAIGSHNMMNQIAILQNHPDLDFVVKATPTKIEEGKVTYKDSEGAVKTIEADSVVIFAGLKAQTDEAAKFIGAANQVLLTGQCTGRSNTIQKAIRSGFFVASQV
jgi:2,4-dienoyl-CoA reductase-like NADH-dependent reductase (Old Yellow Enzyme family)/thioredoxin reductase